MTTHKTIIVNGKNMLVHKTQTTERIKILLQEIFGHNIKGYLKKDKDVHVDIEYETLEDAVSYTLDFNGKLIVLQFTNG
jgi:hypothetical protein